MLHAFGRLCLMTMVLAAATAGKLGAAKFYLGTIHDPDGYSNVRKGPGTEYEVVDTLHKGEKFFYSLQAENWRKVYKIRENILLKSGTIGSPAMWFAGYLHQSRIAQLDSTPSVQQFRDFDLERFTSDYVSLRPPTGDNNAELNLGIIKLIKQEYSIHHDGRNFWLHTGPGNQYPSIFRDWDGYPFLYRPDSSDWVAVYNAVDTVLLGYAPEDDLERIDGSGKTIYYLSYFNDAGEETGFMGSRVPGCDAYFIVPDKARNQLLVSYKELIFNKVPQMPCCETMLEVIREDVVDTDSLPLIKKPCLLYKSLADFDSKGINLLRSYFQRLPIYTDSSFVEETLAQRYLPAVYNPISCKPLFGDAFISNVLRFLNSNHDKYSLYTDGHDSNRLSFQVTVNQQPCYLIYYYMNATFLLSRRSFRNVEYPELDLGAEFESDLGEILGLDVETILSEYGKPIYINEDIIIYLIAPQRQFFHKAGTNLYHGLEGQVELSANGLMFFEIENGRVVVAGSTVFSDFNYPMMFIYN